MEISLCTVLQIRFVLESKLHAINQDRISDNVKEIARSFKLRLSKFNNIFFTVKLEMSGGFFEPPKFRILYCTDQLRCFLGWYFNQTANDPTIVNNGISN